MIQGKLNYPKPATILTAVGFNCYRQRANLLSSDYELLFHCTD